MFNYTFKVDRLKKKAPNLIELKSGHRRTLTDNLMRLENGRPRESARTGER